MRIKEISYSKTFLMDGCENKKVGVIMEVQNDDPEEALKQAAEFIEKTHPEQERIERHGFYETVKYEECKGVLADPNNHSLKKITEAALFIKNCDDN